MLDLADKALLGSVTLIMGFSFLCNYLFLRKDSLIVGKYRLYKVRDDLIYLVASGEISEDDFVFQRFYQTVAFVIEHTGVLTLRSFVAALQAADSEGLDPASSEVVERTKRELPARSAKVQSVVLEFFQAMTETLVENSLVLRCAIRFPWASRLLAHIAVQPILFQMRAYRFYQRYKTAMKNFGTLQIADAV